MSFFDEVDEPRTPPRTAPRRRRPSGGGSRPPGNQQSIQTRRAVLIVVLIVVVVLIALGVHSCQVSARNSALKSYTNSVSSLITQSNSTGSKLFGILSSGPSSANATGVTNSINTTLTSAEGELRTAQNLSVPDQVKDAQAKLLLTMQMRVDAITQISNQIQPALGTSASRNAINVIAAQMEYLYASDVVYKGYVTKEIAAALHDAGIAVGPPNGQTIAGGQFVPDVQWVQPTFITNELHASGSGGQTGKLAPGTHGHQLNSVSVAGTTLQTGSANTITANPAPTFTLNFANSGQNNETNVTCKVVVSGTSDSGSSVVAETFAGKPATCTVKLKSPPTAGTATVVATIVPVRGEKITSNNSLSFPVTFQ